jgi:hypothetical protein
MARGIAVLLRTFFIGKIVVLKNQKVIQPLRQK